MSAIFRGSIRSAKRFHLSDTTFATIVGVVHDIKNFGPERAPRPEVYSSYAQVQPGATYLPLIVRVDGQAESSIPGVIAAIREVESLGRRQLGENP